MDPDDADFDIRQVSAEQMAWAWLHWVLKGNEESIFWPMTATSWRRALLDEFAQSQGLDPACLDHLATAEGQDEEDFEIVRVFVLDAVRASLPHAWLASMGGVRGGQITPIYTDPEELDRVVVIFGWAGLATGDEPGPVWVDPGGVLGFGVRMAYEDGWRVLEVIPEIAATADHPAVDWRYI